MPLVSTYHDIAARLVMIMAKIFVEMMMIALLNPVEIDHSSFINVSKVLKEIDKQSMTQLQIFGATCFSHGMH
jgi:hypothetical protein